MVKIVELLQINTKKAIASLYNISESEIQFQINETKPEFDGDYTIVLFGLIKQLKKFPELLGKEIGEYLITNYKDNFIEYNVIKGFLNITLNESLLTDFLFTNYNNENYGKKNSNGKKIMVEYSSPNTNKPLHLGHLRNNFLGWSIAEIYKANGYNVIKSCIVNDRGIHICKSMIAWKLYGNGATPESTNTKGDHFVGEYYVKFNDIYKSQIEELCDNGINEKEAEQEAPIMKQAQEMLLKWEQGDVEVMQLWQKMNNWVYKGFDETYAAIGSDFDKTYYESNTYLLGKKTVEEGFEKNIFYKKEDNSVWIDLTADGLDEKIVQRKDGTSVYITQDIGLAQQKYDEYKIDISIYVVGNEQDYHFAVLKLICKKIGLAYANDIFHLSYGMVELPSGKMKSREGTVVDADDLVAEMIKKSEDETIKHGKIEEFTKEELTELYNTIGLGAMKFYLLRIDPKKKMVFNPEESIEFQGFTGPFIQYTYARIKSILRKNNFDTSLKQNNFSSNSFLKLEKELLLHLEKYSLIIEQSCTEMNPSVIAIYTFELAKIFNSFYAEHSVSKAENEEKKLLRLMLCSFTANIIKSSFTLLGIKVPERM